MCLFFMKWRWHTLDGYITRRKHGKREPQLFSNCDSFDHPDLQSSNDYKVLFVILRLHDQMFWGVWYSVEKVFPTVYYEPKIPKVSVGKSRKINMQLFSDYKAWWSKQPQWENDCGSFSPCFLLVMVPFPFNLSQYRSSCLCSLSTLILSTLSNLIVACVIWVYAHNYKQVIYHSKYKCMS